MNKNERRRRLEQDLKWYKFEAEAAYYPDDMAKYRNAVRHTKNQLRELNDDSLKKTDQDQDRQK
jgi:hypothetical protein